MPVALISTRTSPAFGPSRSSSTISSGFLASNATAARVFMCFSPNILLEPVAREQIPQHLLGRKHCTLTLHVKAADFASPFFYPRDVRCCERDVLQCSVTPARI